jgi:hypothetical protein
MDPSLLCIQVVVVLGCFAAVGTWRFGSYHSEFATIEASLKKEVRACVRACVRAFLCTIYPQAELR